MGTRHLCHTLDNQVDGLISKNSIMPFCALSATGDVSCVLTIIPFSTGIVQEACGFGNARPLISMSTKH